MLKTSWQPVLRCWLVWIIVCMAGAFSSAAQAQTPQFKSLTFNTTQVNVGFSGPPISYVHVTAHVVEPVSGLKYGLFSLTPVNSFPKTVLFDSSSRTSGTAKDGIYEFDVAFYQFSTIGDWNASAYLYGSGSTNPVDTTVTTAQLQALGPYWYVSVLGGPDITPPRLAAIDFGPMPVDTLTGPKTVSVTVSISDLETGFDHGTLLFIAPPCAREPDGEAKGFTFYASSLIGGDLHNGTYQFLVDIPQYEVDGPWSVQLYVQDQAGNNQTITSNQIGSRGPNYLQVIGSACIQQMSTLQINTVCSDGNPAHGEGGVDLLVTGPDGTTQTITTDAHGSYGLMGRLGDYTVTAPLTAGGLKLNDSSATQHVTLTAGGQLISFHYTGATISGKLYWDKNFNGNYAPSDGDVLLGGVLVQLFDAAGNPVYDENNNIVTTTTHSDGSYAFGAICLTAGSYTVLVPGMLNNAQTNLQQVNALVATQQITVVAGGNAPNTDFLYQAAPGSLSGTIFYDADKDGVYTPTNGDTPLGNVVVALLDANGNPVLDSNNTPVTFTTNLDGTYSFSGLRPGTYQVGVPSVVNGKGLESSKTPSPLAVTVNAGQNTPNNNFGYIANGSLSGTLYVDANKNSSLDSGEAKLGGITVTLKDANGNVVGTTTTAADGTYSFAGLVGGNYSVSAPSTANGYALETPSPLAVTVTAGQNTPNKNFGYIANGSLSGVAYIDLNGDKTYNVGEPLLSGVVITLTKPDGSTATMTTNANGYYQFTNLPAGSYKVSAPATTGGKSLVTSSPLTVAVVANQDAPNNNFGYITTNTSGNYTTFTQGGWGSAPHGGNPGALLAANFTKVFGSAGVTIGGGYTYNFTSAQAVQNFLPQGGTPATFTFSATNPTARTSVFAGQVLALELSISFSNAGITRNGLSSLSVVSGLLTGKTVAQVLTLANTVLGGNTAALAPYGLSVSGLNDIVTNINQNYDNGTTDNHYLH